MKTFNYLFERKNSAVYSVFILLCILSLTATMILGCDSGNDVVQELIDPELIVDLEPESEDEPAEEIAPSLNIQEEFVGSKNSDKYHYPDCSYAESIKESNRVWFDSVQAAAAVGYVACKGCNPPSVSITPPPPPAPSTTQAVYVGSKNSDKYHYPSCGHAKKILTENLVTFSSVADARSKGYVPCKSCNPPSN